MDKTTFLQELTKEAKRQSNLSDWKSAPPSFSDFSSFFWAHTWQILLITAVVFAAFFLAVNGVSLS
jgi:hypothetical protein